MPQQSAARRADASLAKPAGNTYRRALEALPEGGTVLDVGAGAGATSLPLLKRSARLVAVDADAAMLEALAARAPAGKVELVEGRWPLVAGRVADADVVVCAHVLYNVSDLAPFVRAMCDHARRRVVIEITARHPLAWLNPLWAALHGIARPDRPTADDAIAAIRAMSIAPRIERSRERPVSAFEDLVPVARRMLCFPTEREPEVAAALRPLGDEVDGVWRLPERELVTLWWGPPKG